MSLNDSGSSSSSHIIGQPSPRKLGGKGESLFNFHESLRWYFVGLIAYTIAAYVALAWALSGPRLSSQYRVFRSGNLEVHQFSAGLVLSVFLAPAAILLRRIGNDIALLHPFALATQTPVQIGDLDRIMNPGLYSIRPLARYSKWYAMVQSALMIAGAFLVPVGTLTITVDNFAPQIRGNAIVGLPTTVGTPITLSSAMGATIGPPEDRFSDVELFLNILIDLVKGEAIRQNSLITANPGRLGPISTLNITFQSSVRYDGLVTFDWGPGCSAADDEIDFKLTGEGDLQLVEFTFPDGSTNQSVTQIGNLFLWTNATEWTKSRIPLNGVTYLALSAPRKFTNPPLNDTGNIDYTLPNTPDGLVLAHGTWIERFKCTPTFNWEVSSCVWNGENMEQCTSTPGSNTTELDTIALDALGSYFQAVPWRMYNQMDPIFIHPRQLYTLTAQSMGTFVGFTALALAQVTTAGYWGTATIPSTGQTPYPVYIARMPVLIAIAVALTLVTLLVGGDLAFMIFANQLPIRKTSFLTVATAVRGSWWDEELDGRCTLSRDRLREMAKKTVMFGVDAENSHHIGLAPEVLPIDKEGVYFGRAR